MTRDAPAPGATDALPRVRPVAFLLIATAAQVAFWYAATPGPRILHDVAASPAAAARAVGVSLLVLLIVPLATSFAHGMGPRAMGIRSGRTVRFLPWVAAGLLVAAPVLYLASADPSLRAHYPWPGVDALAGGIVAWLAWGAGYALYYLAFEAFYRGFLLHGARPYLGVAGALWLQAALATLIHVGKPLAETVAAFPASLVFGLLALRSRSLVPAVLLHLGIGLLLDLGIVARAT